MPPVLTRSHDDRGKKDYFLICPRCSEKAQTTLALPSGDETTEPFVKQNWSEGTTRGAMALVLALGRLIRKKTRPRQEIRP